MVLTPSTHLLIKAVYDGLHRWFKVYWGVTQGDLLSLAISNETLDAVLRYWFLLVVEVEEGPEVWTR